MSRSARTSAGSSSMPVATHSPADRDVVMGPPPLPPQIAVSAPGDSKGRDREGIEAAEKYKRLKRKYFELEEKYKDAMSELRGSGERSVKLRTERAYLLDRILELEAQKQPTGPVYPGFQQPLSSAYPRSLTAPSAQKRFIVNLDGTMGEAENEDYNLDPLLQSKHVGPIARKRIEAEQKERQEEEQREQKKTVRQPRKRNGKEKEKEKEKEIPLAASSSAKPAGPSGERASTRASERERERADKEREDGARAREQTDRMDRAREATGPPLTLAPAPSSDRDLEMHDADSPPPSQAPVLLATNGQRLRIKPPAPPSLSLQPEPVRPPSPARTSNSTPPSPQQDRHQPQRHEHDDEPRRSPVLSRFDPREDQYQPPERDDMDIDRDHEPTLPSHHHEPPPQFTHPPPLPPPPATVPQAVPQLQGPGQPHTAQTLDVPVPTRPSPEVRLAPPGPVPVPSPPAASSVPSPVPAPQAISMPAAAPASSAPRNPRKRSASPAELPSGAAEDNLMPIGGPSSAQVAMMGQLVLSPPSPYRLTPVDPVPLKPAMQMTFRTSPATHVSQYAHTGSNHVNNTNNNNINNNNSNNNNKSTKNTKNATASPHVQRDHNLDPQLYRQGGVTTPGAHGEHTISFGNGTGSAGSSVAGTPGIGPVPGPFMMQTPLNTPVPTAGAGGSRGKPKRLKAHTVTSKSYSIPMVPRDKAGRPLLPLNVGIMTVLNLGDVCMREHFHTERYIFPVGYEVTRRYLSTVDPLNEAVYHCTILDGGDGPKFQIVASDDSDKPVIAGTATGAWSVIVRAANLIRNRQHSNSVSGPDFFGLGQNTIKHLIQELSGADRLKDYVWQNFVEGGPLGGRHAAVIPALPDEHDTGDGESHYTGGTMGLIAMTPVPASPQASFFASTSAEDSKGELQIIQMDNNTSVGNGHAEANSAASPSTSKSITFQQEFPQRYIKDQRLRDEHGRDGPSDNGRRESMGSSYVNGDYEHGRSQASPPRHTSRSPVVQREPYSPHGHRSPYQPSAASQQPSPPVPATFASIMHAYSASPMSGPGVPEGFHFEHGGSRSKNGSQHGSAT